MRRDVHYQEAAVNLVHDAGGKVVGRTRLQKIAYLLELVGLGEDFNFECRHYGPYSEQLANAVSAAATIGVLSEEERTTDWGGSYSIFTAKPNPLKLILKARGDFISRVAKADPIALELAATAAFLATEGEPDSWGETSRRKPEKAATRLDEAKSLYKQLQTFSTPKSLPKIK